MTMDRTDLHALLGDQHDAVIEKAALPITGAVLPEQVARVMASIVLAAVLPDLLAEAWGEAQRATLDKVTRFYGLSPHEAEFLMEKTPNPYG